MTTSVLVAGTTGDLGQRIVRDVLAAHLAGQAPA